ncbi:hypothetical protein Poli38472_001016 [Pythium oligandrum]|uniref:Uncharacterized protein n=1 Tax=Pythium oligandrum TaxID=41045 RepID=A0A8K1CSP4_PYTOL|nr:hypothetical protein Poli38472_001016 [Pythium oligandrum]|eukprot:TMW68860.1 hypothetical protein Poli38472_001016 [Pythium oligandrum]
MSRRSRPCSEILRLVITVALAVAVASAQDTPAPSTTIAIGSASEESAGSTPAPPPPTGLNGEYQTLYETFVQASESGKGWGDITIAKFTVEDVTKVMTAVITYLCTSGRPALEKTYKSLGNKFPQVVNLSGLIKKNPTDEWSKVITNTEKALKDKDMNYVGPLWKAITAYRGIADVEATVSNAQDLKPDVRKQYHTNVEVYYSSSAEIAWSNEDMSFADLVNFTDVAGKYADEMWWTSLVIPDQPDLSGDYLIFAELALLKHIPAATIVKAPGLELGTSVADKYITAGAAFAKQGDVSSVAELLEDSDLEGYSEIADEYCTPEHTIRFCLIGRFADQSSVFASVQNNLYNSDTVTKLPVSAANVRRKDFLEQLSVNLQAQRLSLELATAFDDLKKLVHTATSNLTARIRDAKYEQVVQQQEAINNKMKAIAQNDLDIAETDRGSSQRTFDRYMEKIKTLTAEIETESQPYLQRVQTIAEAALKEAESKKSRGIFGFIMKVLSVFNPITWIINPSVFVDVLRDGNELRKTLKGKDMVNQLIGIIQNTLIPMFNTLLDKMAPMQTKIQQIAQTLKPLIEAPKGASRAQIEKLSSQFIRAYAGYDNPVMATDVDVVEELFVNTQTELCQVSGVRATAECSQVKIDAKIFDKLGQVVTTSNLALDTVVNMARSAVKEQSAKIFKQAVTKSYDESVNALKALKSEWDKETKANKAQFVLYERKLAYTQAALAMNLLVTTSRSAAATLMACNFLTYLNGGVAVPDCLPMYRNPGTVVDFKNIVAFQFDRKPEEYTTVAYIPTMATSDNDKFLDLERMMNERVNVTFTIPQDPKWLAKYGWIPPGLDLNTTVIFLSKFQLLLPPKQVVSGESGRRVVNVVTRASMSDLGPAVNNKRYEIPTRRYTSTYDESLTAGHACATKFENPYKTCNSRLNDICPIAEGEVDTTWDEVPLPSLFSPLNIYANFESSMQSPSLSYADVSGSAPLAVGVKLLFYSVKGQEIPTPVPPKTPKVSKSRDSPPVAPASATPAVVATTARSLQTATAAKRCCKVGSYLVDWQSGSCAPCPAGTVSQLGGLYCVPPTSR